MLKFLLYLGTITTPVIILIITLNIDFFKNSFPLKKIKANIVSIPEEIITPKLKIEAIFSEDTLPDNLPKDKIITLLATGDIIPARSVNYQEVARNNFLWPYQQTADFLKNADLTLINLEAPLISNCSPTQEGMVFCGDQRNIEGLNFAGVDIANLANNHAGNYGKKGIEDTRGLLSKNNIVSFGIDNPAYLKVKGTKFAFLGYNDIGVENLVSQADVEKIKEEIVKVRKDMDILIVTFHWGVEYASQPTKRQKDLAYLAIDNGADLVIGNHPHWIQPIEIYKDKIITYAHGNFIFDQMWSEKTKEGVLGKYIFLNNKVIDVKFYPIKIADFGQPYFLENEEKREILNQMKEESFKLIKI